MAEPLWPSSLSFSERLEQINKIAACLSSKQDLPHENMKQASDLEKDCYDNVSSKSEYQAQCLIIIQKLNEQMAELQADDSDIDEVEDIDAASPETIVTIGKYTNAHHHQDGLFSFVYKARTPATSQINDQDSGKLVALKVTTPSLMVAPHDSEREARILATCQHPNIIPILSTFWQAGGRFVLIFPFMHYEFGSLLDKGRLTPRQIQSHLRDLFAALSYLHDAGIIHRDIKPSNILLKSPSGPAYLADFGIAWSPNDKASEKADHKITDVGTTCYRPPELLFGNTSYGCSLDLWAAGCVAAEALSSPHKTLFDAGDVGSELALIQSIFSTLGTPNLESWPEATGLRDWGKMAFHEYPAKSWEEIMPNASTEARDLVKGLVQYESVRRMSAKDCLKHSYMSVNIY